MIIGFMLMSIKNQAIGGADGILDLNKTGGSPCIHMKTE